MNIQSLFSTNQRIKILEAIAYSIGNLRVTHVAKAAGVNKGLVSQYFRSLTKAGVITKSDGCLTLNASSSLTKAIRILINIHRIDTSDFKKYTAIQSVGLYGSCAKGENTEDSDIDLWILADKITMKDQAELRKQLTTMLPNPQLLFLTKEKIRIMQKQDQLFYHALVFGSIIIYGDSNAIHVR